MYKYLTLWTRRTRSSQKRIHYGIYQHVSSSSGKRTVVFLFASLHFIISQIFSNRQVFLCYFLETAIYLYSIFHFFFIIGKHSKIFNVIFYLCPCKCIIILCAHSFNLFQCWFYSSGILLLYAHWIYFSNCRLVFHNGNLPHFNYWLFQKYTFILPPTTPTP